MFTRNRWVAHLIQSMDIIDESRDTAWSDGKSNASSRYFGHLIWLGNRVSFVFSLQSWLGESPEQKKTASTPAYMSVLMSCSLLSVPLFCSAGLISWRDIVMALVVVCISNLQDSNALSLTNHCRPISLSSCLRRPLGVPPAPPHRLRWPLEHPNLLNILLHTHHNLHSLIIWTTMD